MDNSNAVPCRTCLGPAEVPINLFDQCYKDYLDVLQRLLGFQISDEENVFFICRHCRGKLIWVTEFQLACLKSLEDLRSCKTEPDYSGETNAQAVQVEDVKTDDHQATHCEIERSDSDRSDAEELPASRFKPAAESKSRSEKIISKGRSCRSYPKLRLRKRRRRILMSDDSDSEEDGSSSSSDCSSDYDSDERVKRSTKKRRKISKSSDSKPKRTKNRPKLLKQFPATDVYEAFRSARKYLFDMKNRQCLICDFVGRDAGMLQTHTHRKHEKEFRKWCKHCNLLTQNLLEHRDSVKCYEQKCELCGKKFTKMKYLKTHLQQHCDTKLFQDFLKEDSRRSHCDQYTKSEVLRAIADSTAYVFELKYRNCLFCDYVVTTASLLPAHMSSRHKEYFKNWCARCNFRTDDLQLHTQSAKCSEHLCVFCKKVFDKVYKLTAHLKLHCRTMGKPDDDDDDDDDDDFIQNDDKPNAEDEIILSDNPASATKESKESGNKKKSKEESKSEFKSLYDQLPEDQVVRALADSTAYLNDAKHKICIYCHYSAPTSINLSSHMRNVHMEVFKDWCRRCNLQTPDLQMHIETSKCSENRCVFCNKMFDKTYGLTRHLKSHCREKYGKTEELGFRIDDIFGDLEDNSILGGNPYVPDKGDLTAVDEQNTLANDDNRNYANIKAENGLDSTGEMNQKSDISDKDVSSHSSEDDLASVKKLKTHGRALKQFPRRVVQRAIVDTMKSYYKNRKCIKCEFLTANRHRLITHMNSAHRDLKGKWCNRCNAIVAHLAKHWRSHESDLLKCVLCGIKFKKTELLKDHLKRHYHSKVGSKPLDLKGRWFCCMVCPLAFPEEQLLKAHKCKDSSNTFVNCKLCKRHVRNLQVHNAQKHKSSSSNNSTVKTPKVKAVKTKPAKVKTVKTKGKLEQPQSHLCPVCGKTFKTSAGMTAHITSHSGETNFKCSICGKCFPNITKLSSHERRHSGIKPFVCHVCGKGSFDKLAHTKHLETHEGGPVQCTICNKEFHRPGVLKLHMRQHTGENQFNCVYCGKSFHIKSLLRYHMRIHNEDRPYKCSFCGKGFKEDATLRNHEKTHTGMKPFKCSICTFSAVQPSALTTHMKQHPEDAPQASRPHKCQFCYRSFSTNALLMSHTDLIHRKNTKKYVNKGM